MGNQVLNFRRKLLTACFFLILITGFAVRLYRIDSPLADWHSWRQADTSAVTRNFIKLGFNLLYPRYDDLSNIASGKENPLGYRFVEFPIYNALTFGLYKIFTQFKFSIEIWGRLVSIFASLASSCFLFLICNSLLNTEIALLSTFFFLFLPFNIYYSRTILPESLMVASSLGMTLFFLKWLKKDSFFFYFASLIFASTALLIKPFAAFLFFPLVYMLWRRDGFKELFSFKVLLFFACSVIPFALWRYWTSRFPEGVPAWRWLLNGDGIRFKGAFFYWLFGERLTRLILGYWGLPLLLLGVIVRPKKEGWFFYWWAVGMFVYLSVVATGNVRHDYYQIITIPLICVFLGKGVYFLAINEKKVFHPFVSWLVIVGSIVFMFAFSWYKVRSFYWINKPEIVEVGKIADEILPKEAKVIAPYGGDTAFLYQINRQGWPIGFEIEEKIKKGATHYISIDPKAEEVKELIQKYKVLRKTEKYIIIDLTESKNL